MNPIQALLGRWRAWRERAGSAAHEPRAPRGEAHLESAADSLRRLLQDRSVPAPVREALAADYAQVEAMLAKLERGDVHLAVFGRVSVGKSALANALLGEDAFEVGVLHGTTRASAIRAWREVDRGGVHVIDTPGINELGGESREAMAHEVAGRSDLVLFVCDGDLTDTELAALRVLAAERRPMLLVLNKADRYGERERGLLLERLREHVRGLLPPDNVVAAAALPVAQRVIRVDADGRESEVEEPREVEIAALMERITTILDAEGKTLAALNAALFAGRLSDQVGRRLASLRADLAARVIRGYCLAKGVAVAVNPIPVADLLTAAALDVGLVVHLGRVYGEPVTRGEAGRLLATVTGVLAGFMGAVWGVHLVSSALKGASAGLSVVLTAGAQGALAWYATLVVGRAAQRYFAQGRSWGEHGPKRVVQEILDSLDRDSVLREAREEILRRLRAASS